MNQEKIGEFIANSRKKKNLTQEQLAEKLNVNVKSVSRWENGRCMPDYSLLENICNILDVTITDLLCIDKMIELKNVSKKYESIVGESTKAIDDISLKFSNQGLTFIVGTSGSGKSTLLNLLGGLDSITSGTINIDGKELNKMNSKELDNYRNTYVGFIFQDYNVIDDYNLEENISLSLDLQGIKDNDLINETIDKVGLTGLNKRNMNELSGGQKQRVAIARALVKKPRLLLADEPTGNLDSKTSNQIIKLLKNISENHLVIVVSHDMELAKNYADRIIEISDGKVINDTNKVDEVTVNKIVLKNSKLPFNKILKLSRRYMEHKVGRLILTILLMAIATFFLAFCLNVWFFKENTLYENVAIDNGVYKFILSNKIRKVEKKDDWSKSTTDLKFINENDFNFANDLVPNKVFNVFDINNNGKYLNFSYGNDENIDDKYYYNNVFNQFVEIKKDSYIGEVEGRMPISDEEVVIDQYTAEFIVKYGVYLKDNTLYEPKSLDSLIKDMKEIKLGNHFVYIVGYVKEYPKLSELFKDVKVKGRFENDKLEQFYYSLNQGYYIYTLNKDKFICSNYEKNQILSDIRVYESSFDENIILNEEVSYIDEYGNINTISQIKKDEVIISKNYIYSLLYNEYISLEDRITEYLKIHPDSTYIDAERFVLINYIKTHDIIGKIIKPYNSDWIYFKKDSKLKIVGVSLEEKNYLNESIFNNFETFDEKSNFLLFMTNDKKEIKSLFQNYNVFIDDYFDSDYEGYDLGFIYEGKAGWINYFMHQTKKYSFVLIIILVIFNILMIYNFINTTIKFVKKNIGILRALGTKTLDIIKIFSIETFVISFISWIISIVIWLVSTYLLNKSLFGSQYIILNGIVINPIVILINLLFILLTTIIITIISLVHVSKLNPIDAIYNRLG